MNMKQLRYVLTLAEEGSFSKASDLLGISQPSLSQYIKKIEKELGVNLFDRVSGNVKLTNAGKAYVEAGRKMLRLERQMQNEIIEISKYKSGTIVIGTTPFRSVTMMPSIVAEFKKYYPGLYIVVDEKGTRALQDGLERGEFDLALTTFPVDEAKYIFEEIAKEEILIAVSKNSELSKKIASNLKNAERNRRIDLKLLAQEEFVMLTDGQLMQKIMNSLDEENDLQLKTAVVVKSLEAQIEMVRKGVGAALIPSNIQRFHADSQEIEFFSLIQKVPSRKIGVVYRKEQKLNSAMLDLIEVMKKSMHK